MCYLYLRLSSTATMEQVLATARRHGAEVVASCTCQETAPALGLALLRLSDTVDVAALHQGIESAVGAEVLQIIPGRPAAEVAATDGEGPLVLMPQVMAGSFFKAFQEAHGVEASRHLYDAGVTLAQAASSTPPVPSRVSPACILRQLQVRVRVIQAYGWADVHEVSLDLDHASSVVLLNTFEASAWSHAPQPMCHFLAGYVAGLLRAATHREWYAREVECQAAGGRVCRIEAVQVERAVEQPVFLWDAFPPRAA